MTARASADMPGPKPVRNRSSPGSRNGNTYRLIPIDGRVLRDARRARGQRSPAAPDSNNKSRKATLVGDEPPSAAFALTVLSFSQTYKSLKQISNESRRILTQRIGRVKQKALILRLLRSLIASRARATDTQPRTADGTACRSPAFVIHYSLVTLSIWMALHTPQ
jgi:hypothetical protein